MATTNISSSDFLGFNDTTGAVQLTSGTTAERPGSASNGEMRFNTDTSKVEYYDGSVWVDFSLAQPTPLVTTSSATDIGTTVMTLNGNLTYLGDTGGNVTTGFYFGTSPTYSSNTKYTVSTNASIGTYTYSASGLTQTTTYYITSFASNSNGESVGTTLTQASATFSGASEQIQWLVVAGGGGSGSNAGGGGGAGGLRTSAGTSGGGCGAEGLGVVCCSRTYTITVGSGGAAGGSNGGNSAIAGSSFNITSTGGGAGRPYNTAGTSGGSGGGGNRFSGRPGGAGTSCQGYAGGEGRDLGGGGGGGGAGAAGTNAVTSPRKGGNGGNGVQVGITGTSTYYAGGGAGGSWYGSAPAGNAGQGGGGGGSTDGTPNTGGGAGGDSRSGGSGVVIMRISSSNYSGNVTGNPTVTTDGSFTIITFLGSGTYNHFI